MGLRQAFQTMTAATSRTVLAMMYEHPSMSTDIQEENDTMPKTFISPWEVGRLGGKEGLSNQSALGIPRGHPR